MSAFYTLLLILFVFLCLVLIASVLLQTGRGGGMAGLGGGASDSAFGAHTANILQKFTGVCVFLFFVMVIILAKMSNNGPGDAAELMDGYKAETKKEAPAEAQTPGKPLEGKAKEEAGKALESQSTPKDAGAGEVPSNTPTIKIPTETNSAPSTTPTP